MPRLDLLRLAYRGSLLAGFVLIGMVVAGRLLTD